MTGRRAVADFSRAAIDSLLANEVLVVRRAGFATAAEAGRWAALLLGQTTRTRSISTVTRLGISQYEQGVRGSKDEYFAAARGLEQDRARAWANEVTPRQRLIEELAQLGYDVALMEEPGFGSYWAGNGKLRTGETPIHVDFSPQDSSGWAVGRVEAQLAWNVYLDPQPAGALLVWDRQWVESDDDQYLVPGEYYFDPAVVDGLEPLAVTPVQGEVLMLNSRNYHCVETCDRRLAYGSFIGVIGPDRLRLWS